MFTSITTTPGQNEVQAYINNLSTAFPEVQILLSGYQVIGQGLVLPANVQVVPNVKQLIELASGE